jgi:hypothetical protein
MMAADPIDPRAPIPAPIIWPLAAEDAPESAALLLSAEL